MSSLDSNQPHLSNTINNHTSNHSNHHNNPNHNHHNHHSHNKDKNTDLYRSLIDSHDLVKELDDIEAISQQISQHAEVLYQNWKVQESQREMKKFSSASSSSSSSSSSSLKKILPSSSEPLDLLASSSEDNGQLKDLVRCFVSSDRAKQAARQTIASTIDHWSQRQKGSPLVSCVVSSDFPSLTYNPHSKLSPIFPQKKPVIDSDFVTIPIHRSPDTESGKTKNRFDDTRKMLLSEFPTDDFFFRRTRSSLFGANHPFRKSAPPHPELTSLQRQHISERSAPGFNNSSISSSSTNVPIRRLSSSGSVAERVLIFEKSPLIFGSEFKEPRVDKRLKDKDKSSTKNIPVVLESSKVTDSVSTPLRLLPGRKFSEVSIKENIPKFYFPYGNPALRNTSIDSILDKYQEEFKKKKNGIVTLHDFGFILKKCGVSYYWKGVIFVAITGNKAGTLTFSQFSEFWRRLLTSNHDEASQFIRILTKGRKKKVVPEDFVPLIQDVVDTHPGLGFLKDASEFHSRYVHTVIARIFFCVNRSWSGQISMHELKRSNFLSVLRSLEDENDINQIHDYFSYEHFYVIYCKFWELDKDHDLFIDREDLYRHNDQSISTRMIDRIFSGTVTRGSTQKEGKMSYTEFVWFLLAEEDKRSPTAIEYWFRCMDLDGDGYLSMYELEYFYEEQLQRMMQLGIETLSFEDCLCQMLDMILPAEKIRISLRDLRSCRMTPIFFDTFFNLEKYLDHEQRDPFASQRDVDEDGNEMSDWNRFASEEYELLVAEEGNPDEMCYDDELENNSELQLEDALESSTSYIEPILKS